MLEVLQNYQEIQDLNQKRFVEYASAFAKGYNEDVFEFVYRIRNYPKNVISFLADILD